MLSMIIAMNLHRVGEKPDWEYIPQDKWKPWHKLAARTDGWVTPGNVISAIGAALTLTGIHQVANGHPGKGAILIGFGRSADLLDGFVADKTGTKSPRGEMVDASADKALVAVGVVEGLRAGLIPAEAGIPILVQQAAITVSSAVARWRGRELHPDRSGKYSMTGAWVGIGGFVLSKYVGQEADMHEVLQAGSYAASVASLAFGAKALYNYSRRAFGPEEQ
jgi:phosphatidylglycerophosphate synthase